MFQILNKDNTPLTMGELDKSASAFWEVKIEETYVSPKNMPWFCNWYEYIGGSINKLPKGTWDWSDIIGILCGTAAIGETDFKGTMDAIFFYEPFIELCLHWKSKGYTPVSL